MIVTGDRLLMRAAFKDDYAYIFESLVDNNYVKKR